MAINFSTSGLETQKYASNIARVYHFEDATHNISISNGATGIPIEFNFTKAYADTNIILWGFTPIQGKYSYQNGCYISLTDVASSNVALKYESAHFVTSTVDGTDHIYGHILFQGMYAASESALNSAGNKKVSIGWSLRNNDGNNRPGNYWNPSERSGRTRDRTTKITILETYGNTTLVT